MSPSCSECLSAKLTPDGYTLNRFEIERKIKHNELETAKGIIEEYKSIRLSTIWLFKYLSDDDLMFKGIASGQEITLGALGFIICGHQRHHREVIRSHYL